MTKQQLISCTTCLTEHNTQSPFGQFCSVGLLWVRPEEAAVTASWFMRRTNRSGCSGPKNTTMTLWRHHIHRQEQHTEGGSLKICLSEEIGEQSRYTCTYMYSRVKVCMGLFQIIHSYLQAKTSCKGPCVGWNQSPLMHCDMYLWWGQWCTAICTYLWWMQCCILTYCRACCCLLSRSTRSHKFMQDNTPSTLLSCQRVHGRVWNPLVGNASWSSNLNPIENLWHELKDFIHKEVKLHKNKGTDGRDPAILADCGRCKVYKVYSPWFRKVRFSAGWYPCLVMSRINFFLKVYDDLLEKVYAGFEDTLLYIHHPCKMILSR